MNYIVLGLLALVFLALGFYLCFIGIMLLWPVKDSESKPPHTGRAQPGCKCKNCEARRLVARYSRG